MTVAHTVVQTEFGDPIADPSGGVLWNLLDGLSPDEGSSYLIAERSADAATYLQVLREDDGQFLVEHQAGAVTAHFRAPARLTLEQAHDVLRRWVFDEPGWQEAQPWEPVDPAEFGG
jgi:hypothetical protein